MMIEQARAWGARESDLKLLAEKCRNDAPKRTIVEIEPENTDAVALFAGMRTQWRVASIAFPRGAVLVRTGLDYACLPAVAQGRGIALSSAILDGLAIMEDEGLAIHAARAQELLDRS